MKVVAPILRVDRPLVGVHVRRTDYINKVEALEDTIKPTDTISLTLTLSLEAGQSTVTYYMSPVTF